MKNFLRRLMGPSADAPDSRPSVPGRNGPMTIEDGSDNAIRRQLVQMLVRDALRFHGIPPGLIECQMLLISSESRGPGMYVRLVVKRWDERIMTYAWAFQKSLLADITRFEPHAPDWLYGLSWQLELGNSSPHETMPDKSFWTLPGISAPEPAMTATDALQLQQDQEARMDLERLFQVRDAELAANGSGSHPPVGYEATQPAPLHH